MRIITNADDFGQDADTLAETIRCFESGSLTSATIMTTMPCADQAFEYAKQHPEFSFGIHLTYVRESEDTTESPACDPKSIPSLVDDCGRFMVSDRTRQAAMKGQLNIDEVAKETEAQIKRALDFGISISHVDSHGHMHKFKPFMGALKQVLPKYGINKVRTVQDVYVKVPWKSPTFWLGPMWRRDIRIAFKTTEHLYLPTSAGDDHWPEELMAKVMHRHGVMEVGVHPGTQDRWRKVESEGTKKLAEIAKQRGMELIGWKDL